ncbi:MAG: hypothetical protein ACXVAY_17860 [Mucilaginibacter sp.]
MKIIKVLAIAIFTLGVFATSANAQLPPPPPRPPLPHINLHLKTPPPPPGPRRPFFSRHRIVTRHYHRRRVVIHHD